MHLTRCRLKFDSCHKVSCPVTKSKQKTLVYNIRVKINYFVYWLFFRLRIMLLFLSSWRAELVAKFMTFIVVLNTKLMMLKFSNGEHFVILIEMDVHLIICINTSLWLLKDSTVFVVTTNITVCLVWLSGSVQGPSEADLSIICQWGKISLSTQGIFYLLRSICVYRLKSIHAIYVVKITL